MAERWGGRWRLVCSCTVQCAVKYGEIEAEGCLIGIKSDKLIGMVALTNVDFRAGPGQRRVWHSSILHLSFSNLILTS